MISKQKKLIVIFAVIFCILLGAYFALVVPVVNKEEPVETTAPPETTDGEVVGIGDRILMFEKTERSKIESIEVWGEHGNYKFYRDGEAFKIKGHENVTVDAELFASFITSCGYTISVSRIDDPEPFSEYGLDDEVVKYTLTTTDGEQHTVRIGDKAVSGSGYYACYEGRDNVYILDPSVADTLLKPVANMVTPLLSYYEYSADKKLDFFNFFRGTEQLYFRLEALSPEDTIDLEAMATYKMTYPTNYVPSEDCDKIFQGLSSLMGTETVSLGPTEEDFKEYGLDKPKYQVWFGVDDTENILMISEQNEDGSYYVGSSAFDIIAKVDGASIAFVEYDLIKWISPYIFRMSIDAVDTLEISGGGFSETFKIEGTGDTLTVRTLSNGSLTDVNNFKNLYKTLVIMGIEGDPKFDEAAKESASSQEKLYMTMKVKTRSGLERSYAFYRYSDRRCFLEINGSGDFYILHNVVAKVRNDAEKVVKGETVDPNAKYD